MTWFKIDDKSATHPKVLQAGNAAWGLLCRLGAWSCDQLTDGAVPSTLASLFGTPAELEALVTAGLLERTPTGWQIHDFLDRNPSRAEVLAEREAKSEAGRRGNEVRWGNRKIVAPATEDPIAPAIAPATALRGEVLSSRSRPDPDPSPPLPTGGGESRETQPKPVAPPPPPPPSAPAPAAKLGVFGIERDWFAAGVREATGNRAYVAPSPARCGALLEVLHQVPEAATPADAERWLRASAAAFVRATKARRQFWPLAPDAWARWVGEGSPSAGALADRAAVASPLAKPEPPPPPKGPAPAVFRRQREEAVPPPTEALAELVRGLGS